jgi:hypothetical protein
MVITNTVDADGCNRRGATSLNVRVLAAPVGGSIDYVGRNCNTIQLQLTGYQDQIVRWEYTTDGQLWNPINTNSSLLSYTITTNTNFRAIVSRSGSSCQEVRVNYGIQFEAIPTPTLNFSTNGSCTRTNLTVSNSLTQSGTYRISPVSLPAQSGTTASFTGLAPGTYTVTFDNGLCVVQKTITISSNPTTPVNMLNTPYSTSRSSITPEWIAYSGASSYTLQWRLLGSNTWNTITGITDLRRAVTGLACNTAYQFRVRAICSSGAASPYSEIRTFSTSGCTREGISSDFTASDLSLYPNPNNGNFNLNFVAEGAGSATLFVADLTGKTVTNQTITVTEGENNIPVSLDGVVPGIYLVRFTVGENTFTQKVIVE